jgi:hypothetical protein
MPTPVTRPRVNASCRSYGERIGLDAGSVGGTAGQVAEQAPLIANCAGWGARELVPDPSVRPVRGQQVIADNQGLEEFFISAPFEPAWTTY